MDKPLFFGPPAKPDHGKSLGDEFDVIRQLKTPVWVYDIDNCRVAMANEGAVELWKSNSETELVARDLSVDMSPTVAKRLKQYQKDFQESEVSFQEAWTLFPNDVPTTVMVTFSGYRMPDGRMAMMCEAKGTIEGLPENLRSTEALLHTDVMITLYRHDGTPLYMNPAARNAALNAHVNFKDIFCEPELHTDIMWQVTETGEARQVAHVETSDGSTWQDLTAKQCTDAVTGEPAILVTAFDVSALKNARDQASYLADMDQLTGCYNRSFITRRLDQLSPPSTALKYALLYCDLDRFKHLNDNFGHEVGDVVLRNVSHRIRSCLKEDDIVARFGGDEFVALISNFETLDDLLERVEAIQDAIKEPILHASKRLNVTSSIGLCLVDDDVCDWSEAMRRADIALYEAKAAGRNHVSVFDVQMGKAATQRSQIESDLIEALKENQFTLFYQPRLDAKSGRVVSAEALVRWLHPERGLIPPNQFIPICEETGMIEELGYFVMEKACAQVVKWHARGLNIGVSINVSPRQFLDPNLLVKLKDFASRPGFQPGSVELEITESVLIGDHDVIASRLSQIIELGYRLSIDDFGTGYSNLAYITRFSFHCIKIDKSFVDQLPASGPVISLIQAMADQIGASTVAEGVETLEQVEQLHDFGSTQFQGFYFSEPVSSGEFDRRVNEIHSNSTTS